MRRCYRMRWWWYVRSSWDVLGPDPGLDDGCDNIGVGGGDDGDVGKSFKFKVPFNKISTQNPHFEYSYFAVVMFFL